MANVARSNERHGGRERTGYNDVHVLTWMATFDFELRALRVRPNEERRASAGQIEQVRLSFVPEELALISPGNYRRRSRLSGRSAWAS